MGRRGKLLAVAVVLGFVALLLYGTLASQKAECSVEVEYKGQRRSATASAASVEDAEQQARTTACGTMTQSMNDRIACDNAPPVIRRCRAL